MPDNDAMHVELRAIKEDMSEIKGAMAKVADALERLARLEERQATAGKALERAFAAIEKNSSRIAVLEQAAPVNKLTSAWVQKGAWAALGAAGLFVLKKLGLA